MVSDPFAHHPSENLEGSTAITPVTAHIMDHAGQQAARLVETAAGPFKAGKKGRKLQAQVARATPAPAVVEPMLSETTVAEAAHSTADVAPVVFEPAIEAVHGMVEPSVEATDAGAAIETALSEPVVNPSTDNVVLDTELPVQAAEQTTGMQPEAPIEAAAIEIPVDHEETASEPALATAPEPEAASEPVVDAAPEIEAVGDAIQEASNEIETVSIEADASLPRDHDVLTAFHNKVSEVFHTNMDASLSFWLSMINVRSASKAVELNTQHLRQQIEAFMSQSQELSALARQAATTSMMSLVGSFGRLPG